MDRRRLRSRRTWPTSLTLIAVACAALLRPAFAVDAEYGVNAGFGTTDNITRVAADEVDESMATVGAFIKLNQESTRLHANLAGNFSYLDYLDDTYDDDVIGTFTGNMVAGFVPDMVEWVVSDTFGQTTTQPLQPVTPENRENVNYFSTGPRLTVGHGWLKTQLDARYSDVGYEVSDLDNARYTGDLALIHQISEASALSLNGHYDQVDYDQEIDNADFDRKEGFLRYAVTAGRTRLSTDIGVTEVGGDVSKESGFLGRLQLTRRTSPASALSLSLGRDISDAGLSFVQLQGTAGTEGTQPVQPTGNPFVNTYGTLGWSFDRGRTGFGASVSHFDESFERTPALDRTRSSYGIHVRRNLTPNLQARAALARSDEDFDQSTQKFAELYGMVQLQWAVGMHLSLDLQYEYFDGDGDGEIRDYTENRLWLRLAWAFGRLENEGTSVPISTGAYR